MSDPAEFSEFDRYRFAIPDELKAQTNWLVWRFEAADKPGDKPVGEVGGMKPEVVLDGMKVEDQL